MKSIKLHIKHLSNPQLVEDAQRNYTHGFWLLYNMLDEGQDPNFIDRFRGRFGLTDIGYRSLYAEVKAARNQDITNDKERLERIQDLLDEIQDTDYDKRYNLYKKITKIRKRIGKSRTFGGVGKLRSLTKECNKVNRNEERIEKLREEYRQSRQIPLYIMGEGNKNGNRFFDVTQLNFGKCVYKPQKGEYCDIDFKVINKKDLERVSKMAKNKKLPVSVHLTTEYLVISFDEEVLNGFNVDEKSAMREVREMKRMDYPDETTELKRKEVWKRYFDEQREHKMEGKIADRCIAIDLNPTNIGWSVLDKKENGGYEIVECGQFEYSWLCRKLHKPSSSPEQKKLNNKRKYELSIIVKKLFNIAMHYKCGKFIMEDLSFKTDAKMSSKESNRKNKNLWCRELITQLITRRCNETGIILEKINACYSSFIGNIQHGYVDATNASIEIGRRGLWKYTKGTFYPDIRLEDLSSVEAKFGADAKGINTDGWVKMYNALKALYEKSSEFSHRLRTALEEAKPHRVFSMDSCRSGVRSVIFT